jgi:hypothetical protein
VVILPAREGQGGFQGGDWPEVGCHYRWAFGPPGPALARARGGSLNYGSGQPDTNIHRVVSCPFTGCGDTKPRPVTLFRAGLARNSPTLRAPTGCRSPQ